MTITTNFSVSINHDGSINVLATLVNANDVQQLIQTLTAVNHIRQNTSKYDPAFTQFINYMEANDRVHAIQSVRAMCNFSLKEAKDLIEGILDGPYEMPKERLDLTATYAEIERQGQNKRRYE